MSGFGFLITSSAFNDNVVFCVICNDNLAEKPCALIAYKMFYVTSLKLR